MSALAGAGMTRSGAAPGVFLVLLAGCACRSGTHEETVQRFSSALTWLERSAAGGPFTGSWVDDGEAWLTGPLGATVSGDDGDSWRLLPEPVGLHAVDGIRDHGVWFVGDDGFTLALRGGVETEGVTDTTASLRDVSTPIYPVGYAVGDGGTVLTTQDAGDTWASSIVTDVDLHAVDAATVDDIWIAGDQGTLLHSGGDGWSAVAVGTDADLLDVAAVGNHVVAVGGDAHWSGDGGESWTSLAAPAELTAVTLTVDPRVWFWATSADGTVWSWDGASWTEEARTSDGAALLTVSSAFDDTVVAAGTGAVLMYDEVATPFTAVVEVENCRPSY